MFKKKTFEATVILEDGTTRTIKGIPDCPETRDLAHTARTIAEIASIRGKVILSHSDEFVRAAEEIKRLKAALEVAASREADSTERARGLERKFEDAVARAEKAEQETADIRTTYAARLKPAAVSGGLPSFAGLCSGWAPLTIRRIDGNEHVKPPAGPADIYVISDKDAALEIADMKDAYTAAQDGEHFPCGNRILVKMWHRLYELGVPKFAGAKSAGLRVRIENGVVYVEPVVRSAVEPVPRYHYLAVPAKKGGCKCKK